MSNLDRAMTLLQQEDPYEALHDVIQIARGLDAYERGDIKAALAVGAEPAGETAPALHETNPNVVPIAGFHSTAHASRDGGIVSVTAPHPADDSQPVPAFQPDPAAPEKPVRKPRKAKVLKAKAVPGKKRGRPSKADKEAVLSAAANGETEHFADPAPAPVEAGPIPAEIAA